MNSQSMKSGIRLLGAILLWASCSQDVVLPADGTVVSFSLSGIGADVATRGENLAAGTTVRVVAYKGTAYVTDNVYMVDQEGHLTSASEMRLIEDTYDFYAVSPALDIASKSVDGPTFEVGQGIDFAANKVTQKVVAYSGSNSASTCGVPLGELERKCSKLTFDIALGSDIPVTVTSLVVMGITFTGVPATLTATGATLEAGSSNGTLTIPADSFITNGNKVLGGTIVPPKTDGAFTMSMDVRFNGSVVSVTFPATAVSSMGFDAGKHHVFTVKLLKDRVGIWTSILPTWTGNSQSGELGGDITGTVTGEPVGAWTSVTWSDSSLGGTSSGTIQMSVPGLWNNIPWGDSSLGDIFLDATPSDSWIDVTRGDSSLGGSNVDSTPSGSWTDVTYNPGLGSSNPDNNK